MADAKAAERTICQYRWSYPLVDLTAGAVKNCCRTSYLPVDQSALKNSGADVFLNHPHLIRQRILMMKGTRSADCNFCWKMEDEGIPSPRVGGPQFTTYMNGLGHPGDFRDLVRSPRVLEARHPQMLEIKLDNTCDLKCLYCDHSYSSAWEAENRLYGQLSKRETRTKAPEGFEESFWDWFETCHSSLKFISFAGGELLLMPKFYEVLDRIVKIFDRSPNASPPLLSVISNFNGKESTITRFVDALTRLSPRFKILLLASVDTVGRRAEFIRTGLVWERMLANLHRVFKLKLGHIQFAINPTINALSVTSMIELLRLAKSLQNEFQCPVGLGRNMVVSPAHYNPLVLTPDFAEHLDECAAFVKEAYDPKLPTGHHGDWNLYVEFLSSIANSLRQGKSRTVQSRGHFYRMIKEMDRRRGSQFLEVFPEYRNFFNLCAEAAEGDLA